MFGFTEAYRVNYSERRIWIDLTCKTKNLWLISYKIADMFISSADKAIKMLKFD